MSLQMLASEHNADGKVLPRAYQVQYRDAATGAITRVETVRQTWQQLGQFNLPATLSQIVSSANGVSARSMTLNEISLGK